MTDQSNKKNKSRDESSSNGDQAGIKSPKNNRPTGGTSLIFWFYLIAGMILLYMLMNNSGNGIFGTVPEIEYTEFKSELEQDNVQSIHVQGERIEGTLKEPQPLEISEKDTVSFENFITYLPSFGDEELFAMLEERNVTVSAEPESDSNWWYILAFILPVVIFGFIAYMFYQRFKAQGQGFFNIGKSKAKLQEEQGEDRTTFDDVAGTEGAKKELSEIIDFLKNPERYEELGAELPKGILLLGPPGTGKTLLARAVAGEADVPFFTITGSDFMEMFVGVGAKRVREMFKNAKEKSPSIIFVDELDSIGRKRGAGLGGGHDEREQTLNQLLSELDGFEPNENVVVMGATNRPDILDKALLRPGRFDRQISIDLPTQGARVEILKIHARNKTIGDDVDFEKVARGTPGFSGADLENLLNEASFNAGRDERRTIKMEDIEKARDKVMMGLKKEGVRISDREKKMLAYHEAGHAIVAASLTHTDPLHKVTIIPRGKAMGITQQLPEKEKYIYEKDYLLDRLAVLMGGRAAEQLIFDTSTSGAQNDLQQVTKLARKMVKDWGMSDKFGHLAFGSGDEEVFIGREMGHKPEYSDPTARDIDQQVNAISREAYERAENTLKDNKDAFDKLADLLLEHEEVSGDVVTSLIKGESVSIGDEKSDEDEEKDKKKDDESNESKDDKDNESGDTEENSAGDKENK
ncbi:ATP-dependent zinc metalloprotease FtsH [Rhodohalobacter sp. 8-1]|uniref:ATP-dependent zinc metalloprotease FtsH n=1 Tax=Rhodohalobacter sp. 8-1 TaxID=3131972 RepID=UPI0030ED9EC5